MVTCQENINLFGPPKNGKTYSFEECSKVIVGEIRRRKPRWFLNKLSWLDYDDVTQIILIHVFVKWYQWKQNRFLLKWLNALITNQTRNIVRNVYSSFQKPCNGCAASENTDDSCRVYGTQCSDCPIYAKWLKSKEKKQAINLAESYEEIEETVKSSLHYINSAPKYDLDKFHSLMLERLTVVQAKAYRLLFIENLDEATVSKKMNYKPGVSKTRNPGYRQIAKFKHIFVNIAKDVLENNDGIL